MIQRIQSVYMVLLILINMFIVISLDSNPEMSLPESYFGYFRPYIDDYFFSEILSFIFLINILLFKYPKIQLNVLRFIFVALIFGIINFFDERSLEDSFKDLGLYYFVISLVLIFLTFMGIKKDQAIINSSNRLR